MQRCSRASNVDRGVSMKHIKDLNSNELRELVNNNKEFRNEVNEFIYDDNMRRQELCFELWLPYIENRQAGWDADDCYGSFYLSITDSECFINNLDSDYLSSEDTDKLHEARDLIYEIDQSEDYDEELADKLQRIAEDILKSIEQDLHEFEDVTHEQLDQFIDEGHVSNIFGDWGVDSDGVVYQTIVKSYK